MNIKLIKTALSFQASNLPADGKRFTQPVTQVEVPAYHMNHNWRNN